MRVPLRAGAVLDAHLHARSWTQKDFAEIIGRPLQSVNEIINGKKAITPETATQIGAALGTGPQLWLNLQNTYNLWILSNSEAQRLKLAIIEARALERSDQAAE